MTFRRFALGRGGTALVPRRRTTAHAGAGPHLSPELQSVQKLLDKYNDPIVAVHDGFYSSLGCISYPNGGGEGSDEVSRPARWASTS